MLTRKEVQVYVASLHTIVMLYPFVPKYTAYASLFHSFIFIVTNNRILRFTTVCNSFLLLAVPVV